ncbi:hypothetical protein K8I61_10200 [bacterium]|nr:hypothetical protein [bacterium]
MIVMWSNDLMFKSKVRESAGSAAIEFAGTLDQLLERLAEGGVRRVLVDMDVRSEDLPADLARIAAGAGGAQLVIFGSHKNVEMMTIAREAGFHKTLARSQFVSRLSEYLG